MTFDVPPRVTSNLKANCPSHARTDVSVRHHFVVIDEPAHRGGTDANAAPLELLLSSHLGCTNVVLNMLAEEKGVQIDGLSMTLAADLDTNGLSTRTPTQLPFRTGVEGERGQRRVRRTNRRPQIRTRPPLPGLGRPARRGHTDRRNLGHTPALGRPL